MECQNEANFPSLLWLVFLAPNSFGLQPLATLTKLKDHKSMSFKKCPNETEKVLLSSVHSGDSRQQCVANDTDKNPREISVGEKHIRAPLKSQQCNAYFSVTSYK